MESCSYHSAPPGARKHLLPMLALERVLGDGEAPGPSV